MCPMHGPSRRPWGHAAFLAVMRHAAWWAVGAVVLATGSQAAAESLSTPNTPDSIKALIKICEPPDSGLPPGEEPQNCYTRLLHEILRTQGPTLRDRQNPDPAVRPASPPQPVRGRRAAPPQRLLLLFHRPCLMGQRRISPGHVRGLRDALQ